jgi:FkbM family methyltransferase
VSKLRARIRHSRLMQSLRAGPAVFRPGSWLRFLVIQKGLGGGRATVAELAVRRFGAQRAYIRRQGTDWETVHSSLIGGYHRPPAELHDIRTILDLGANIGITVADLAVCAPQARILGVELDAGNLDLARRNTARWTDRVELLHGAVWTEDGTIAYGGARGAWAFQVLPAMRPETATDPIAEVPAFSMNTLLDRLAPGGAAVDYVKMDVEGAESALLDRGAEWASRVRCMKVEIHLPLDTGTACRRLRELGFRAEPEPDGVPSVTAWR